jgi:hypothetical protein
VIVVVGTITTVRSRENWEAASRPAVTAARPE